MKRIVVPVALLMFCHAVGAQWRGADGGPAPDTDARKSLRGFGGWVVITSDVDWKDKWNVSQGQALPSFNEVSSARRGETLVTLILLANPLPNSSGEVNVRCDLRVTRPDGRVAVNQRNLACMDGRPDDPSNLFVAGPTLKFVGDEADSAGAWRVDVTLHDAERDVVLELHASFELIDDR